MKNLISITIALLLNVTAVFADAPYMATGIKIGEVTATEAIVWVRLTAVEKRVDFGAPMPIVTYTHVDTGEPLDGRLMLYDALQAETRIIRVAKRRGCPVCAGL